VNRVSLLNRTWMLVLLAAPARAQDAPPSTPIAARARATLKVPGYADFLVADGPSVWATNKGRIEQWYVDRPGPTATVAVPAPCGAMSVAYGSIWVANCRDGSIYRVSRRNRRVTATIPTGLAARNGELSLAAGAGAIWVLSDSTGVLSRVDPSTNRVVARIPVAPYSYAAVFGFDAVWITNTGARGTESPGAVQRIDPGTNRVVATVPVGPVPRFLAAGEGGIWTLNQGDGSVSHVDPRHNSVAATIQVGAVGPGGDIATGRNRVWVRATKILLSAIDPQTNQVTERFGPPVGSGAVRVAEKLVWVSAHDIQTIWVLEP
jgi:virginiamycin B lyase